jgi:uncharacterized protein (DUF885 family)
MRPTPPAPPVPPAASGATAAQVDALAHDVWELSLDESPISATFVGDPRGSDRLDERGPAARTRREAQARAFERRLEALPLLPATSEAGLTQRVLARNLADAVEENRHHLWQIEMDQLFGPHLLLAQLLTLQPVTTPKDAEDVARRIEASRELFAQWQGDLEEGLAAGRLAPRIAVERVIGQLEGLSTTPRRPRPTPCRSRASRRRSAPTVSARLAHPRGHRRRRRPWPACSPSARAVLPARTQPGLCHVPGAGRLRWRVRNQTTTDLTAGDPRHRLGGAREELPRDPRHRPRGGPHGRRALLPGQAGRRPPAAPRDA